jgi:hypothetical protein
VTRSGRFVVVGFVLVVGLAGCTTAPPAVAQESASAASRPADLRSAHAVFTAWDASSSRWTSYPRLYSATVADGRRHPLLPDGILTARLVASPDGSVIVYDAAPASMRAATDSGSGSRTQSSWWWASAAGGGPITAMPADVHSVAVTDDRSVVAVVGEQRGTARWSVVRIGLDDGQRRSVCDACLQARPDIGFTRAAIATSGSGSLLATSTWGWSLASGFYGMVHATATDEQVRRLSSADPVWRSGVGYCQPVSLGEDGALVRTCSRDDVSPLSLHLLTGTLGPTPTDRDTHISTSIAGPLEHGWWYALQEERPDDPVTIYETSRLTPASSTVVGRWPGGVQIEILVLAEVTSIDGPYPSVSASASAS